jgi:hypothetical protein
MSSILSCFGGYSIKNLFKFRRNIPIGPNQSLGRGVKINRLIQNVVKTKQKLSYHQKYSACLTTLVNTKVKLKLLVASLSVSKSCKKKQRTFLIVTRKSTFLT